MQFSNLSSTTILAVILWIVFIVVFSYTSSISRKKIADIYPLLFQKSSFQARMIFLSVIIIVLILSFLQPSISSHEEDQTQKWIDVLFLLDVSKSMNALDFEDDNSQYSRIQIAKTQIKEIVTQNLENRYGLVIFAGDALSISPLTSDSQIFLNFLSWVDYRNINTQWTNLEEAYLVAVDRFTGDREGSWGNMLILLSDGWDIDDITNENEIRTTLKNASVPHAVIAIWKNKWARIPNWYDVFWVPQYQQFQWRDVISKVNARKLKNISEIENWLYYEISSIEDIPNFEDIFWEIEKKAIERWPTSSQLDLTRIISFFVFFIFIIMLIYPLFKPKK